MSKIANTNGVDHGAEHNDDGNIVVGAESVHLGRDYVICGEVNIPTDGPVELLVLDPDDVVDGLHAARGNAVGDPGLAAAGVGHFQVGVLLDSWVLKQT